VYIVYRRFDVLDIYPDDEDRDGHRNVGILRTPNAADSPRRLCQVHSPREHQDQICDTSLLNISAVCGFKHTAVFIDSSVMKSDIQIRMNFTRSACFCFTLNIKKRNKFPRNLCLLLYFNSVHVYRETKLNYKLIIMQIGGRTHNCIALRNFSDFFCRFSRCLHVYKFRLTKNVSRKAESIFIIHFLIIFHMFSYIASLITSKLPQPNGSVNTAFLYPRNFRQ
jgi:hypothetical protein